MAGLKIDDILAAADRIKPYAHRTPVLTSQSLNTVVGARVYLKCENFQKAGAFKFRGACNAVFSLPDRALNAGVATHSSGNHAAALALAARLRGVMAHVVMPRGASAVKRAAVETYGARIIDCAPTMAAREAGLKAVVAETGAEVVHPYNDYRVMAGQGTAALELLQDCPALDILLTPLGGGGLLSGCAVAARALKPDLEILGIEPAGADDAQRSFLAGRVIPVENPQTIADGLRATIGDKTLDIIRDKVDAIVTLDDAAIVRAMHFAWERLKIIIEPSAAIVIAALLERKVEVRDKNVGVILSGGNVDLYDLPWKAA